jgi:hypothetical protein
MHFTSLLALEAVHIGYPILLKNQYFRALDPAVTKNYPDSAKAMSFTFLVNLLEVRRCSICQFHTNNPLSCSLPIDTRFSPLGENAKFPTPYLCPLSTFIIPGGFA